MSGRGGDRPGAKKARKGGQRGAEVTVRAIASGGAGVADLPDGRVVFVPRTAPGDVARVRIRKSRPRWAVATLDRLLEEGPDRADPACSLYAKCGGCQLQHLPYERQLHWKAQFVTDALARIGGIDGIDVGMVEPSPRQTEYRSRVTFTLRRLPGGYTVAGFHALGRPAHVIDVHNQCLLPEPALMECWQRMRAAWGEGASELPRGGRLQLTLRLADEGVEVHLNGGAPWEPGASFVSAAGVQAVWHTPQDSEAAPQLVFGESSPGGGFGFEQVNREAADLVRAHVLDVVGHAPAPGSRLIDGYAGTGVYGRAFAARGWNVEMIEVDASIAGNAPVVAPDAAGGDNVDAGEIAVTVGRLEDTLSDALPADLVVVNPPRSGMDSAIPPLLNDSPPQRIVYVSCDPGTLARDIGALADRYEVTDVRAFDLFPQTAHVEVVAVLSRRDEGGTS